MMSRSKPILWVSLLIFCFPNSSFCSTDHKTAIISCPEIEKQALLSFKESITGDPLGTLSSWNMSLDGDCCNWRGVSCSNSTGRVDGLHLHGGYLQGRMSPSLLNLTQLKHLNLMSRNSFEETMPSFVGSLVSLWYLDLDDAGFHGMIPSSIGNLSNINTLSLGAGFGDDVFVDSLEWMTGLSRLQRLVMNGVNLSRADDWIQVIGRLPSLVELRLPSCGLDYMAPVNDINVTSLTILDLSSNNFLSPIPSWIFRQSNLVYLDLGGASFDGPIPAVANFTKLQHLDLSLNSLNSSIPGWLYSCKDLEFVALASCFLENTISDAVGNLTSLAQLDLSDNALTGKIPRGIGDLCKMQRLDLRGNMLGGEISDSFGNMSDCFLGALTSLDLSENQLSGHLTHQFGEFKSLEFLALSVNRISGEIPANLGELSSLETLQLNDNKLTGNLPMSMGQLSNLTFLYIENNMLEGVVTEIHFVNLTMLMDFSASGNHLTLNVSPDWVPSFNLSILQLGSWNLGAGSSIPSWLRTQINSLHTLDISSTGISGNVPTWLLNLNVLNISHNHLSGTIPDIIGSEMPPRLMYFNSNQFSGLLPRVGNTLEEINPSNNSFSGGISHLICDMRNESYRLVNLHLGGNHLAGEIPDCWMKWPLLRVLNLGNNNFSGTIPNSIGSLKDMSSLNLYENKLSGQIPVSVSNCSELVKMDLSSNYLVGNIPTWIGASLPKLRFLILRSNKLLSGVIPSSICYLNLLQILDISDNVISGIIPACVSNFTAMTVKRNLSNYISGDLDFSSYEFGNFLESASVATKGNTYVYGTILSLVMNIDLSNNNLSGEIPEQLTSLVELKSLNLSGNHLTGSIPMSIGDMKQVESLDLSRNSLVGEIPDSFTTMSSLSYLNLSYNHLTGKIPRSTQLTGMNASGFIGNNLCGLPLPTNCSQGDDADGPLQKEESEGEMDWFYVFLSLGYAVGLSFFCTTLVLKKSWRSAYFRFIECIWNKLYVYFHIKWRKLRRH